jgi:hypothetical protein
VLTSENEQTDDEKNLEEREVELSFAKPSNAPNILGNQSVTLRYEHPAGVLTKTTIDTRNSVHQTALLISVFQ